MKATDRVVLLAVLVLGLFVAFYLFALGPKREKASQLNDDVAALETSISGQEQVAAFAEQARKEFPEFYTRMVVLGKAVPEQADSASLLVQLNAISNRSQVDFLGLELGQGTGAAPTAPAPTAPAEGSTPAPAVGSAPTSTGEASTTSGSAPAAAAPTATAGTTPATETVAATLPIGAVVGPAGLPTLPYDLTFRGNFFEIAGFISGVDGLVHVEDEGGKVGVNGRLLTIDGFNLQGGAPGSIPDLDAQFVVTGYVTPAQQGLTLGATPGGPAISPAQPQTTPASAEVIP